MANDLMMPRWAQVGAEVSQIHHYRSAGLGDPYSEGRRGKIVRVLKTQVEVEFKMFKKDDPNATVLVKFKLVRGYTPFTRAEKEIKNVRVDRLEEMGKKWSNDFLWPSEGKDVAYLRAKKERLQNSHKMQGITQAFTKKSAHHIGLADVVELMEELHKAAEEREKIEERLLEIDAMPQDR